jgi:hypothetical protein
MGRVASMQSVIAVASQDLTSLVSAGLMLHLAMYVPWKRIVRVGFGCSREIPEELTRAPVQERGPKMAAP